MNDFPPDASWSPEAQAQEILRRLTTYPEHFARFLKFEREYLRRYRENHPHDLGPLPGRAQCLTAFRNEALLRNRGHGIAEFARKYRERNPPTRRVFLTFEVDQPEIPLVPEDEWMPTYRLLVEIEAAMDEERLMARQEPAEDTPEAPFGLPPDTSKPPTGLSSAPSAEAAAHPSAEQIAKRMREDINAGTTTYAELAALSRKELMRRYPGAGRTTVVKALKSLEQ
jgi:hypothetical protein